MEVCPVFIDETGALSESPARQPIYGIGALVIPDTKSITDNLYKLHFNFLSDRMEARGRIRRNVLSRADPPTLGEINRLMRSTRHHEYKFAEITRFNIEHYVELISAYFSFHEPQFHAVMLDRLDPAYSLSRWDGDIWRAYANIAGELLERQIDRDVFAIVDLQGKPSDSPIYLEDVLCSAHRVKGCLRATSDMSVYLQIVDILLGCVQFDMKDANGYYAATSRRAAEKRDLVSFVKGRLGLSAEERILAEGETFSRWETPSAFSVYRGEW